MLDTNQYRPETDRMAEQIDAQKMEQINGQVLPPIKVDLSRPPAEFGQTIVEQIDPTRELLDFNQRAFISRIQNQEELEKILYANLGDTINIDLPTAQQVFGCLMRKNEIPQMLEMWHFYCIMQCQLAINDGALLMNDKKLTTEERVSAYRLRIEAIKSLNYMITNAKRLARLMGVIKPQKEEEKPQKIPSRAPPKLD